MGNHFHFANAIVRTGVGRDILIDTLSGLRSVRMELGLAMRSIDYHLDQCVEACWSDDELYDALNVALVVGGSIVIPHLRHAFDTVDQLRKESRSNS